MAIPKEDLYVSRVTVPGTIPEHNPVSNIRTFAAEEDDITFGRALMGGTDGNAQVKTFGSASGKFKGVAGYSTEASDLDNSQYDDEDVVAVIDQGPVMVYVEEAIVAGDSVRIRHTTSGTSIKGSFCKTAVPGETALLS
ncbi:MAG: hypothetical protein PHT95_08545, partial [Candidatus Omnitrophica bacterium]|nr:hypothetical protein [Candidatus Omnitrophota bacterium]